MVIPHSTPASSQISSSTVSALSNAASSTTSTDPNNNLASEQTFLKLFVAQLQNQDPLNPNEQDPTQMVSELAQFSELEQLVNIGQNVQSIDNAVVSGRASTSSSQGSTPSGSGDAVRGSSSTT
jgi:flagellar basal-body rod modification protein FlgD